MTKQTIMIKNAKVLDPITSTVEERNVYISDGKLTNPLPEDDLPVLDVNGCYLCAGFLDSHVHVFEQHAAISIAADQIGIRQGVLTVVDAGSAGINNFSLFEQEIIDQSQTEILYFLNIARFGLCNGLTELTDPNQLMTAEELANFQQQHDSRLVGLKVRMSGSVVTDQGINPLLHARRLSEQSGLPLMVHIGNAPPKLGQVLDILQKGDIVTHCFHGKEGGIADFPSELKAAQKRGVRFDVGHGSASFSFDAVPKVMAIENIDFSISTDLYDRNFVTPVGSLMETMSKFLPFDYQIADLVRRVTVLPRQMLGLPLLNLQPGTPADLTIFKIAEQTRAFIDAEGEHRKINRYFQPVAAIKQGKKVWSNGF